MSGFLTIHVTQKDIDKALINDSGRCVVSTAVKRVIPDAKRVETDMQTIRWTTADNERVVYITPYQVMDYIVAFDDGVKLEPFSFRLYHDKKVTIPKVVTNSARKTIDAARVSAYREKKKAAKVLTDTSASRAQKASAKKKVAEAEEQLSRTREKLGPEAKESRRKGEADRLRVPRVQRTLARRYGMKVMRINQAKAKAKNT
jgi:hypothetical protein